MVEHSEPLDVETVEPVEQTADSGSVEDAEEYLGRHRAPEIDAA